MSATLGNFYVLATSQTQSMWLKFSKKIWFPTNHGQKWKVICFNLTLFNPNECTEKTGGCD